MLTSRFLEARTLTTRVILVRHGQSTYNAEGRIQGRSDASVLTEAGERCAQQVGQVLANLSVDAAYSSPLQRAYHTAEILLSAFPESSRPPLQATDQLMEIDLPLWEGMRREEIKEQYGDLYRLWQEHPQQLTMTVPGAGGDRIVYPVQELYKQTQGFWRSLLSQHRDQTLVVVAHNGVIRALLGTALGTAPDQYKILRQSNCGISVLNFAGDLGDGVQLESMNLTAHLGEPLPDRKEKGGVRLLLVRHGETEWNRMQRFQGQIDIPLNANGHSQAQKAATFLKDVSLDFAITSPLLRPKETAEAIVKEHSGLDLATDDRLKEIGHGLWEGKLESEIQADYGPLLQAWKDSPATVQMPEGENLQQVWDRAVAAWQDIVTQAPDGSTGLVVAHDAVNKAILCHVLGLQPQDFWAVKQGNGAVTVVDYPKKLAAAPVLQALNITTHLGAGSIFDSTAAGAL
ncbi:histidine phosphatase family protein [Prochlorothrix hollandica]|uniref:histidine phosphatase family protein n=1 Tax=Prochlorothrix hollandica TaxID=1223 RepID=UPI000349CC8D|nr:histidine phosphatase family protein [Prochlorothrix hollandica]